MTVFTQFFSTIFSSLADPPAFKAQMPIAFALICAWGMLTGCRFDMRDQPRYEAFEQSSFFADQAAVRPRVEDTVARGHLRSDPHLYVGRVDNRFLDSFPFTVTQQIVERGGERYGIYCTPCHGLLGDGKGVIQEYGMKAPPSFHDPDLREQPAGYYFSTITDGTRVMPSFAAQIRPDDRWAIVAYIRALQLSQGADPAQIAPEDLAKLGKTDVITK